MANGKIIILQKLRKKKLGAVVYHIWKERNWRIFTDDKKDEDCLFKVVINGIKLQLMSLQVRKSNAVNKNAKEWDVNLKYARM